MTELPSRHDIIITVYRDSGHLPNPAEFAVAAERAEYAFLGWFAEVWRGGLL